MRTFPSYFVLAALVGAASGVFAQTPSAPEAGATQKQTEAPPAQQSLPILTYSPWAKFCTTNQESGDRQVCHTGWDGRQEDGRSTVSAVVIEPEGATRRILRVTLPLGVALRPGSRAIVDEGEPMSGPYQLCQATGCFSDYEASVELIARLKKGRYLILQAMQPNNQAITRFIPLAGFEEAYDGPPTDPRLYRLLQRPADRWPLGDYWTPSDRRRMFGR
jgi:invasion protein IalB